MSHPIVFATTHRLEGDSAERLAEVLPEWLRLVESQPGALASHLYVNADETEATNLLVLADVDAMERHVEALQAADEHIHRALRTARTTSIQLFGPAGPLMQQLLEAQWNAGVRVTQTEQHAGGFTRTKAAALA